MATPRKTPIVRRQRPLVLLSLTHDGALNAIIRQAHAYNWDLLDLELTNGMIPRHLRAGGALISCLPTDPVAMALRASGVPIVRIGRFPHPQDDMVPAVLPDLELAGRLAADHFLERGFRHLAHVGSDPWSFAKPMHDSFVTRVAELGLPLPSVMQVKSLVPGTPSQEMALQFGQRNRFIQDWLQSLPKPVAILAYSDLRAASLCVMCREAGISVPDEVALLGYGNQIQVCEVSPVAISSIDSARDEVGRQAACLLHDLMAGAPVPAAPLMVPPRGIVARRSTEVLAVHNPAVARAIRFLWDHLDQDLSVNAVAAEVGLSRRSLERAFEQSLGRSINAELRRKRLAAFCELLTTTDLSVRDLAPLVGFHSADFLHTSFRKAYGTTPQKWRRQARAAAQGEGTL